MSCFLLFSIVLVDDASGHYATGFFWGNNYWTGSMALCRNIYKDDDDFVRKPSKNIGLSTSNGNGIGNTEISHVNPPFFPRFGVLKVVINDTQTTPTVSILDFSYFSNVMEFEVSLNVV